MKHCEALVPAATARSMGLDWQREKIECIAEGDNRLTLPAPSPGWPPAEVRARYEPVRLGERGGRLSILSIAALAPLYTGCHGDGKRRVRFLLTKAKRAYRLVCQ